MTQHRSRIQGRFVRSFRTVCAGLSGFFLLVPAQLVLAQAAATDLAVRVTATSFMVGMPGRYVISVANNGPATTDAAVSVDISFPPGLAFASASGAWNCNATTGGATCQNLQPLVAGRTSTFTVNVSVDARAVPRALTEFRLRYGGDTRGTNNVLQKLTSVRPSRRPVPTWTPTATLRPGVPTPTPTRTLSPTVSATPTLTATATASATPVAAVANLALSKTVAAPFFVNRGGTYRLTVSNLGPNATNVPFTIVDPLPRGLSLSSVAGTDWSCSESAGTVSCSFNGSLPAGGSTSLTLVVQVSAEAYPSVTNTANLLYNADPDPSNNTARRPTTVKR
jgi:uncharacterized repeat protein (TIGR01451 family)